MTAFDGAAKRIALQFGAISHFNEGLGEFSRQLGLHVAAQARQLKEERGWHFSFILPEALHGYFGDAVAYRPLDQAQRRRHRTDPAFDVWHGLHQHMRFRPPLNARKRIVTVHDLNHRYAKSGLSLLWQDWRLRRQVGGIEHIVAITDYVRRDIQRWWPWAPPVSVIHNGVADLSAVQDEVVPGVDEGTPFFFHISRMSPSKNVEALLGLAEIWPQRQFVFAGPASVEVARHQEWAKARGLGNVCFACDVTERQKAWLYRHCAAFLFPSLMEGFGLPPVEAMYFGKPVIVARKTSLPEVCGEAAFYWDEFSPQGMKVVVERALANAEASTSYEDTVRARARKYDWELTARSYLSLYGQGM